MASSCLSLSFVIEIESSISPTGTNPCRLFTPLSPLGVLLSGFRLCEKSKRSSRSCVQVYHRIAERSASADLEQRCWNECLIALVCPTVCPTGGDWAQTQNC